MREEKGLSRLDRPIALLASVAFWTIIGSICLAINIYYRFRFRFLDDRSLPNEEVFSHPNPDSVDVRKQTGV